MNNKKIVVFSVPALAIAVAFKAFWSEEKAPEVVLSKQVPIEYENSDTVVSTRHFNAAHIKPAVLSPEEIYISEGVKQQMADIADSYEENIRYPTYSTPLHTTDWNQLNPRAFVSKAVPLAFNEGISAELLFDKYIVHADQDLPVTLELKGTETDRYGEALKADSIFVSAKVDGKDIHLTSLSADEIVNTEEVSAYMDRYSGVVSAQKLAGLGEGEILFSADISFSNNEQARVSSALKLTGNDATLGAVGAAYVEGANLIIPVEIDAKKAGFYRLQANLFDEQGEQPISHLNASFMLQEGRTEEVMKVHASTLRAKGDAGPYLLKDINLTRGPAKPGDKTGYGSSSEPNYSINGFDLETYSQEEYVDPKAQQRLQFLQKMAGIN